MEEDASFCKKIGVPLPTLDPIERQRRRIVWRNERFLYHGVCHICKKNLITCYPPESRFPILCHDCFWSDLFDPLSYGRDFDFNRPFFDQMADLLNTVPQISQFQANCVNSDYAMNCINNKNCYLMSGADFNEDCMYGFNTQRSKSCLDHILIYDSELCYGCLYSARLYGCVGVQDSENCSDSWFLFDCKGCSNCAFSSNLRNKKYVLENQQLSKEEYEKKLAEKLAECFESPDWLSKNLRSVKEKGIQRYSVVMNGENVTGNYIRNSKNIQDCYDAEDSEDCRYGYYILDLKDCCDCSAVGWGELVYETVSGGKLQSVFFSNHVIESHDVWYSRTIFNCSDIFGSVSLKNHQQYIILNKKYSPEAYAKLLPRIVEHMKKSQSYGEFFPPRLSPYEYNRSMAIDHMPLTKEEALGLGYRWFDESESCEKSARADLPLCEFCGKNFLILPQEDEFYRKIASTASERGRLQSGFARWRGRREPLLIGIPRPKFCWACRAKRLISLRRPYQLFQNRCTQCQHNITTSIPPQEKGNVYCEKCYLSSVY